MEKRLGCLLALVLSILLVAGCGGGGGEKCTEQSCSGHGTCDDASGKIVCTCNLGWGGDDCSTCATGYQDNDHNGTCQPNCPTANLNCHHGSCDDASGTARCICQAGYSGEWCDACASGYHSDGAGNCIADQECLPNSCSGHGACEDTGGVVMCTCDAGYTGAHCENCAAGYQDNDANGTCLPNCTTAQLDCGAHGHCADASGTALCACDTGYSGAACETCAAGYQDHDTNGSCLPDCATAGLTCSGHGTCADASGTALCVCDKGYTGADCGGCAVGYQDNDTNGTCLPDCATEKPDCTSHGHCEDSSGTAVCVCDTGYAGLFCQNCANGYQDNDSNGTCNPDCSMAQLGCVHGNCSDSGGLAVCICQTGYAGPLCDACAAGYQDNDSNGTCEAGCAISGLNCGTYGTCNDENGTPHCVCYEGYTGANCTQCATGYQDNDANGTCHPTCALAQPACVHGSCSDSGGQAICLCNIGWAGELCDRCAPGYQDNDNNQSCEPNCATAALSCGSHGHCEDTSGTAICVCDTGYTGANCTSCAAGYQDNDSNGTCLPNCQTSGYATSCAEGGHGSCSDSGGQALCLCNAGYYHDGQGHCLSATGFDCASPIPIPVANAVYQGTTVGAGDEYDPSCSTYNPVAPEVVYTFTVTQAVHMKFTTEGFDTIIYLRSNCTNAQSEIDCDDDDGPGTGSLIERDLQPGTYFLFIDGWSSSAGAYTLTVEVTCGPGYVYDPQSGTCVPDPCIPNPCTAAHQTVCEPVPPDDWVCHCDPGYVDDPQNPGSCILDPTPTGENCSSVIFLDVVDSGSTTGSTTNATNDATGSCAGAGPDRVYGFTLGQRMRSVFDMTGYDTVLHLRTACADAGSQVACDDDGGEGTNARIGPMVLEPGSYFLWADSYGTAGGNYTLTYSFRADPCADEEAVCPGVPTCQAASDWSSYQCVCPEGYLPFQGDCVDDPCDPNLCNEPHKNRCVPDLPGAYICLCNLGYIDDPNHPGTCIQDPNANEWLFMVYLNADSNLDPAGHDDLAEMMTAGSTPYVHIVVLMDTAGDSDDGHARKLYVRQGSVDVVEDMGEIDMGNWQTLRDFGIWAVQNYPARHHALVMWDHGSGWDLKKQPDFGYKGFSYDYQSGNNISVAAGEYEQALAGITAALGDKLDLVGHDECLMGMWEVAAASAPYAHYFVASEETEPFDGWAYDGFLPGLIANPQGTTPLQLAINIVDAYYNASSSDDTLAAIDLDTMAQLNSALNAFADQLRAASSLNSQIDTVRSSTQTFYEHDYRDLRHFAMGIAAMSGAPSGLVAAAQALIAQLQTSVVHYRSQSGYPNAYGLSIYLPSRTATPESAYLNASWCQSSTWDEFLQGFNR